MKNVFWIQLIAVALLMHATVGPSVAATGDTTIAKWHDDKKAVFLLMFDDTYPSDWQVALPALTQRGLIATFYINPGRVEYTKFKDKWTKDMVGAGMVLANHTMTHKGVADKADGEKEIGDATQAIYDATPNLKSPRLVSFGMPGVPAGKWNLSKEDYKELLEKYHLIDRPTFAGHGAVYHWQTPEQMLALADSAIAKGEMEYLVVHGIERREINWGYQDMWPLNVDILAKLLDGLKERETRGDLWVTDHITWHCYKSERENAKIKVLNAASQSVSLELTCTLDSELYNHPLTLKTQVPEAWKKAQIVQGKTTKSVPAEKGLITFEAIPGAGTVQITVSQ